MNRHDDRSSALEALEALIAASYSEDDVTRQWQRFLRAWQREYPERSNEVVPEMKRRRCG